MNLLPLPPIPSATIIEDAHSRLIAKQRSLLTPHQHDPSLTLDMFAEAIIEIKPLLASLFKPVAMLVPISPVHLCNSVLALPNGFSINSHKLATIQHSSPLTLAYAVNSNLSSPELLIQLHHDYLAHQFAHLLATEIVGACARWLHEQIKQLEPQYSWLRLAVSARYAPPVEPLEERSTSIAQERWDPLAVASLIDFFPITQLGISSTEAGSLYPTYSLLGIAVASQPH